MEEKRLNIKGVLLVFFLVMGILIITIGSAYAIYKYQVIGEDSSSLIAGDIYMHYKGQNTGVNIGDAMPSETYDPDSYFEFTIDGKNTNTEKDIWYEIDLVYGDQPEDRTIRLKDSLLKFTLFEKIGEDGEEKKVLDAVSYESINNTKIWTNKISKNTNEETKITYKLYMWISDEFVIGDEGIYTIGEWNEQVYASVKVNVKGDFNEKEPDEPKSNVGTMITTILNKAYQDKEIIALDVTNKNNVTKCDSVEACAGKKIEYRYSGPEVNNYIYLKDNNNSNELWRIIGIFEDEKAGQYIKIVRDEVLPESYLPTTFKASNGNTYTIKSSETKTYWNKLKGDTSDKNNWPTAGLKYYLNAEQETEGTEKGYLHYLSDDVKSKLVPVKYYLGTVHTYRLPYDTPLQAYAHERDVESCVGGKGSSSDPMSESSGCHVWAGNDATWYANDENNKSLVSLMYPSDYGLSAVNANWDKPLLAGSSTEGFEDAAIKGTSWMFSTSSAMSDAKSKNSWLLSPTSWGSDFAALWYSTGSVYGSNDLVYRSNYGDYGIRPVLSLSSSTTWYSGDGTAESPYEIFE